MVSKMTVGSLFAGIGGLELGLESTGRFKTVWQVERDEYASKVLAKHWPNATRHDDVCKFPPDDSDRWKVDVICGGFPCQDISYAGKGAGLDGERSGLFFEAVRIICDLEPRYFVLENVAALLARGLDRVLGTLASVGYDAVWHCIPAAHVGAPHIRDRVFVIGSANPLCHGEDREANARVTAGASEVGERCEQGREPTSRRGESSNDGNTDRESKPIVAVDGKASRLPSVVAHAKGKQGRDEPKDNTDVPGRRSGSKPGSDHVHAGTMADAACIRRWSIPGREREQETERAEGSDREGWWETEPDVGRVADGVPSRVDRLRCLGNAVVPHVAAVVGEIILGMEATNDGP